LACIIFRLGMAVGFYKAGFSYRWGENYHRNFGGPRAGFLGDFFGRDLIESHGTVGKIIKVEPPSIIIDGKDGIEKDIVIKDDTAVKKMHETIAAKDLKIDDFVVVVGSPNNAGQIEAKLIRVMPSPATIPPPGAPHY